MRTLTVVEGYMLKAIRRASFERLKDGTIAAWIPECPGVQAFGADLREALIDLYDRLDEWMQVSLAEGNPLPVLDGLDLNTDENRKLVTPYEPLKPGEPKQFFESEAELEEALSRLDQA